MKNHFLRLLSLLLCAAMVLCAVPGAFAAEKDPNLDAVSQEAMVETIIFLPAEQHEALKASAYAKIPASTAALSQLQAEANVDQRYAALEAIMKTNPFVMYRFTELIIEDYNRMMKNESILMGLIWLDLLPHQDKITGRPANLEEVYSLMGVFLDVIRGNAEKIAATEKLLCQDESAKASYGHYLEVQLGKREAEKFPYLNSEKVTLDGGFRTGVEELDAAMNSLLPDMPEPEKATVTRISGTNRIKTAIASADKLKEVLGVSKFQTIVVANAMNFPDALSGSYLAAATKAPILLYADGQALVTNYIKDNLTEGGKVYILGGTGSVSENIVSILEGIDCQRVSGSGRYGTSLEIIKTADEILGTKPGKILICDGTGFADSLSASATGLPILLVNGKGDTLRDDQKAYLESVRGAELYVIGGTGTIIPAMMDALKPYDADVERIYGSGRELTSVAVA
ncbi:MAG: cell wall-binding repeat-containing protein, partial [Oscillospiraceae bacterium]|nr:cell wall-binding repeat-containing protein [Oscillospiraceae bacterium]